jgi:hypothetical protein
MRWMCISLAAVSLALTSCGGTPKSTVDELTGCASDEQWRTFDDAEGTLVVADDRGPVLTAPTGTVPFSPKPVLKWNQDPNTPGKDDGDVPYLDGPGCQACCPQFNMGSLTTLHLPAISGNEYDLRFSVDGSQVYRVITTLQEWAPPDAVWSQWKGKTVSVKIIRLSVLVNSPKEGPFVASQPSQFSVGQ